MSSCPITLVGPAAFVDTHTLSLFLSLSLSLSPPLFDHIGWAAAFFDTTAIGAMLRVCDMMCVT